MNDKNTYEKNFASLEFDFFLVQLKLAFSNTAVGAGGTAQQTIGGDRMVGPLGVVVLPFRPTSRIEGRGRTTTLRRRDVGAVKMLILLLTVLLSWPCLLLS